MHIGGMRLWPEGSRVLIPVVLLVLVMILAAFLFWTAVPHRSRTGQKELATKVLLGDIAVACAGYSHDEGVRLSDINLDNGIIDVGAKALAEMLVSERRYLNATALRARGNIKDDPNGNHMLVDAWGNPIVFISRHAYASTFRYRNARRETVIVHARADAMNEEYQLWSLGANGLDDAGKGDDITLRSLTLQRY